MKQRLLSMMLALIAILAGARAQDSDVQSYGFMVGGVLVTSENASNITGENIYQGTVSYDVGTHTLTLDNAVVGPSGTGCLEGYDDNAPTDLTIRLIGDNQFVDGYEGWIYWWSGLSLNFVSADGKGSFTTMQPWGDDHQPAFNTFIMGAMSVSVDNCTVELPYIDGTGGMADDGGGSSLLTIKNNGVLKVIMGINNFPNRQFDDNIVVLQPSETWWSEEGNLMVGEESSYTTAQNIIIGPAGMKVLTEPTLEWRMGETKVESLTIDDIDNYEETISQLSLYNPEGVEVTYRSSNENVAYVTDDGTIQVAGVGMATISAVFAGNDDYLTKTTSVTLTVNKLLIEPTLEWRIDGEQKESLNITGLESAQELASQLSLYNPSEFGVTYRSTNSKVVTVTANGTITVVGYGEATINAIFGGNDDYQAKTASITLTIIDPVTHYGFTVGDVDVNNENAANVTGGSILAGKVSYDPATKTLTLDNAVIGTTEGDCIWKSGDCTDLTIRLVGKNQLVDATTSAFNWADNVSLKFVSDDGTGVLTTTEPYGEEHSALSVGTVMESGSLSLTIDNCTVEWAALNGGYGSLTVTNNGTLKSLGGIVGFQTQTFDENIGVIQPEVTYWYDGILMVVQFDENGNYIGANLATNVIIGSLGTVPTLEWRVGDDKVESFTIDDIDNYEEALSQLSFYNPAGLDVTYETSNQSVASVTADGIITVAGVGETTISAVFAGNDDYMAKTVSLALTVNKVLPEPTLEWRLGDEPVTEVAITEMENAAATMNQLTLYNPQQLGVSYEIDNMDVVTFGAWTMFEVVGEGKATINAVFSGNDDYRAKMASVVIKVGEQAELTDPELAFNKEVVTVKYGQLPIAPTLLNQYRVESLTWTSSNADVATVSEDGVLTVNGLGRTQITVDFEGDDLYLPSTASYWLSVSQGEAQVSFDQQLVTTLLNATDLQGLVATTAPADLPLSYSSADGTVATVDSQTGAVTLAGTGTTTITATFVGSELYAAASATYTLSVTKPEVKFADLYYQLANPQMSYNMTLGGDEAQPELYNPQGLAVTYTTDDPDVATIDANGILSLHNVGYTWVTAKFAGTDEWAPAYAGFMLGVQPVPAIDEDTEITFDTNDFEDEDLSNTTINDVLYTLDESQGDSYDSYDQSLTLQSTLTGDQIEAIVSTTEPGSSEFADNYSGLSYLLKAGKGAMEIDFLTMGDRQLTVKVGNDASVTFYQNDRGTITIDYDVPEDTWVYIYASLKTADTSNNARARYAMRRAPVGEQTENALKLYSITITPGFELPVSESGYATYYNGTKAVQLPEGVKAGIVTSSDDGLLSISYLYDGDDLLANIVPAGTAVLIAAKKDDYVLIPVTGDTQSAPSGNLLHGSDTETTTTVDGVTAGYMFYKLTYSADNTSFGFYWGATDGGAFTSPAHKAWLALPESLAKGFSGFALDDASVTGIRAIDSLTIGDAATNGAPMYNLSGQRVSDSYKGIVIQSGKKKVVK